MESSPRTVSLHHKPCPDPLVREAVVASFALPAEGACNGGEARGVGGPNQEGRDDEHGSLHHAEPQQTPAPGGDKYQPRKQGHQHQPFGTGQVGGSDGGAKSDGPTPGGACMHSTARRQAPVASDRYNDSE